MIQYDPHYWRSHLFDIRGSMVREIFARVTICVVWSILVVSWDYAGRPAVDDSGVGWASYPMLSNNQLDEASAKIRDMYWPPTTNPFVNWARQYRIRIPMHGHTLIGVALGLLLVFRTNASYDRFWEGRRQWGGIVNDSRNIARLSTTLLKEDRDLLDRVLLWTIAWPWSLKHRLRGKKSIDAIASELPTPEVIEVENAQHVPLAVSRKMTELVDTAKRRGLISDMQLILLDGAIQRLIDALGACERIHNTPLPFAYMVHLRRALIVYLVTLPMALVSDFGWITAPAVLLIAYILLGVEEIGVEIEDPFGDDVNDLPLKSLCETIENNLQALRTGRPINAVAAQANELRPPK